MCFICCCSCCCSCYTSCEIKVHSIAIWLYLYLLSIIVQHTHIDWWQGQIKALFEAVFAERRVNCRDLDRSTNVFHILQSLQFTFEVPAPPKLITYLNTCRRRQLGATRWGARVRWCGDVWESELGLVKVHNKCEPETTVASTYR